MVLRGRGRRRMVGSPAGVGRRPGANGGIRVGVADRGTPAGGVTEAAPPCLTLGCAPDGPRDASAAMGRSARPAAPVADAPARAGAAVRLAAS